MRKYQGLILCLLASCASPGYRATCRYGEVLVPRDLGESTAPLIARNLERCLPIVCSLLGIEPRTPVLVRVVKDDRIWLGVSAVVEEPTREILLGHEAIHDEGTISETLGHELTHWELQGPWLQIPFVLQEGVAYYLGCFVTGKMNVLKTLGPPPDPALLDLSWQEAYALSPEGLKEFHDAGFEMLKRLTFAKVKAMVQAGQTSAGAFAAALGDAEEPPKDLAPAGPSQASGTRGSAPADLRRRPVG